MVAGYGGEGEEACRKVKGHQELEFVVIDPTLLIAVK